MKSKSRIEYGGPARLYAFELPVDSTIHRFLSSSIRELGFVIGLADCDEGLSLEK